MFDMSNIPIICPRCMNPADYRCEASNANLAPTRLCLCGKCIKHYKENGYTIRNIEAINPRLLNLK